MTTVWDILWTLSRTQVALLRVFYQQGMKISRYSLTLGPRYDAGAESMRCYLEWSLAHRWVKITKVNRGKSGQYVSYVSLTDEGILYAEQIDRILRRCEEFDIFKRALDKFNKVHGDKPALKYYDYKLLWANCYEWSKKQENHNE